MKTLLLHFFLCLLCINFVWAQDSLAQRWQKYEVSLGTPMIWPLFIGYDAGPRFVLEIREKNNEVIPPINISFKKNLRNSNKLRNIRTGISFGFIPEYYIDYYLNSNNNYYLLSNVGIERGIEDDVVDLYYGCDMLFGYLQLPGHYFDGYTEASGLQGIPWGIDFGGSLKVRVSKHWFFETEMYFGLFYSYYWGDINYWKKGSIWPPTPSTKEKMSSYWEAGATMTKFLGINIGYKF